MRGLSTIVDISNERTARDGRVLFGTTVPILETVVSTIATDNALETNSCRAVFSAWSSKVYNSENGVFIKVWGV